MRVWLPARLTDRLLALPETGMGYQVVDLVLSDGTVVPNVVVLNAELAEVPDRFGPLQPAGIVDVRASGG